MVRDGLKYVDGGLLFFDFLYVSTTLGNVLQDQLAARLQLYMRLYQKSSNGNLIINCTKEQLLTYAILMHHVYETKYGNCGGETTANKLCVAAIDEALQAQAQGEQKSVREKTGAGTPTITHKRYFKGMLEKVVFMQCGALVTHNAVLYDDYMISDRLAKEQHGGSNLVALSRYETQVVNNLLRQLMAESNKYLSIVEGIQAEGHSSAWPTDYQLKQFMDLFYAKISMVSILRQLAKQSPCSLAAPWAVAYVVNTVLNDECNGIDDLVANLSELYEGKIELNSRQGVLEQLHDITVLGHNVVSREGCYHLVAQPPLLQPQVMVGTGHMDMNKSLTDIKQISLGRDDAQRKGISARSFSCVFRKAAEPWYDKITVYGALCIGVILSCVYSFIHTTLADPTVGDTKYFMIQNTTLNGIYDVNECTDVAEHCNVFKEFRTAYKTENVQLYDNMYGLTSQCGGLPGFILKLCSKCELLLNSGINQTMVDVQASVIARNHFKLYYDYHQYCDMSDGVEELARYHTGVLCVVVLTVLSLVEVEAYIWLSHIRLGRRLYFVKYLLGVVQHSKFRPPNRTKVLLRQRTSQYHNHPPADRHSFHIKEPPVIQQRCWWRVTIRVILTLLFIVVGILCSQILVQVVVRFNVAEVNVLEEHHIVSDFYRTAFEIEQRYNFGISPDDPEMADNMKYRLLDARLYTILAQHAAMRRQHTNQMHYIDYLICKVEELEQNFEFCKHNDVVTNVLRWQVESSMDLSFFNKEADHDFLSFIDAYQWGDSYENADVVACRHALENQIIVAIFTLDLSLILLCLYPDYKRLSSNKVQLVVLMAVVAFLVLLSNGILISLLLVSREQYQSVFTASTRQTETELRLLSDDDVNLFLEQLQSQTVSDEYMCMFYRRYLQAHGARGIAPAIYGANFDPTKCVPFTEQQRRELRRGTADRYETVLADDFGAWGQWIERKRGIMAILARTQCVCAVVTIALALVAATGLGRVSAGATWHDSVCGRVGNAATAVLCIALVCTAAALQAGVTLEGPLLVEANGLQLVAENVRLGLASENRLARYDLHFADATTDSHYQDYLAGAPGAAALLLEDATRAHGALIWARTTRIARGRASGLLCLAALVVALGRYIVVVVRSRRIGRGLLQAADAAVRYLQSAPRRAERATLDAAIDDVWAE